MHEYTITVNQPKNGRINPSTITVKAGGSQYFNVSPYSGYEVSSLIVDGIDVGEVAGYTFENVTGNHTITAKCLKRAIIPNKNVPIVAYIKYAPDSTSIKLYESDTGYDRDDENAYEYQEFNPNEAKSWRVMYNNNGQLDIVSKNSVATLWLSGETAYSKGAYTLNKLCEAYANKTYATSGRCLGYSNNTTNIVSNLTYDTLLNYKGKISVYNDENYTKDVNQIVNNNLIHTSVNTYGRGYVWLASRVAGYTKVNSIDLSLKVLGISGSPSNYRLYSANTLDFLSYGMTEYCGFRPVISLKKEIRIVDGKGTEIEPYVLWVE